MTSKSNLSAARSVIPWAVVPRASRIPIFFVLLLFAVVYLGSAFTPGLMDDADSTHAQAAREMYVTQDYVTLKVNGNRYLEKAPLMYWLVSFSYSVFGVNEFATRLPTVLAMLGLTLLAMTWARRAFAEGERVCRAVCGDDGGVLPVHADSDSGSDFEFVDRVLVLLLSDGARG